MPPAQHNTARPVELRKHMQCKKWSNPEPQGQGKGWNRQDFAALAKCKDTVKACMPTPSSTKTDGTLPALMMLRDEEGPKDGQQLARTNAASTSSPLHPRNPIGTLLMKEMNEKASYLMKKHLNHMSS